MATSCACKKESKRKFDSSWLSVFGAFFIALLPKCPFCIMAYSSAITLCSGKKLYDSDPTWASFISIGLAIFTLTIILYNYKGSKTICAAVLVVVGSAFIFNSEFYSGEITHYNIGAALLLLGVWLNANLMYFIKRIQVGGARRQKKREFPTTLTSNSWTQILQKNWLTKLKILTTYDSS